jgi:hypothetical protein
VTQTLLRGSVGIGTTSPLAKLDVAGTNNATVPLFQLSSVASFATTTEFIVNNNGSAVLAGTLTQNSDQRLKTNIQSLDASSSLAAIDALNPVTFNWIDQNEGSGTQVGFIAQQVQAIFPELVSTTSATALTPGGTLGLNYIDLISPIVSAIQALYSDVLSLDQTVAGFAQSFTSETITATNQLCVNKSDGAPICITGDQLAALLAGQSAPSSSSESSAPASTTTPPTITINAANPAIITIGDSYADLGATVSDTGQGQAGDPNLGLKYFLNGALVSNIVLDTSEVATDTIDYVVTDNNGLTSTSTRTVIIEVAQASGGDTSNTASTTATSTSQ